MSEKRIPDHRPFLHLVLILMGSAVTLTIMVWGSGSPWLASRGNIVGGVVLAILLTIIGFSTGIWMLIGASWRRHPRHVRLDLAFAYLAVGWIGGRAMLQGSLGLAFCAAAGLPILVAYLVLRPLPALRHRARDEELFP